MTTIQPIVNQIQAPATRRPQRRVRGFIREA